jgi:chromosome segregation ATPase
LESEVNRLKQDLEEAEKARSEFKKQVKSLEEEVRRVSDEKTLIVNRISTFEGTVTDFSEKLEIYTYSNRTAVERVNELKANVNATTEEVESLFKEIETILA